MVRVSARLQPTGYMQPRMAVNAAQHKIVNSLKKHYEIFFVIMCSNVFHVAQDNSSSRVAQRRQKVGHPRRMLTLLPLEICLKQSNT